MGGHSCCLFYGIAPVGRDESLNIIGHMQLMLKKKSTFAQK